MIEVLPTVMIIAVPVMGLIGFALLYRREKQEAGKKPKSRKPKDRNTIVRDANRRLAQNPKDAEALLALAELYYEEKQWDKARKTYQVLIDLCATNPDLDEFDINMKYALASLRAKQVDEAYKALVIARSMRQDVFDVNYNLGFLEFKRRNYEKAAALLQQARAEKPEHVQTQRYLGHALYKIRNHKDALALLRKVIDTAPDDKETLYVMGQCYFELTQHDQALKVFTHLRPDPELGPSSSLYAGTIHMNQHQYPKAIMDFEIGLRHEKIPKDVSRELRYRLASAYIKEQDVSRALTLLQQIYEEKPEYKDVRSLIRRYQELNSNKNLQTYLMATTSEFVTLCRGIAMNHFAHSKTKVVDITVEKNEYADLLVEVHTPKWEDLVLFRFVRTTGTVGELLLRDLYGRIKDMRAGRGFCMTAGTFTENAHAFVEARLIDLVEKDALMKTLHSVDVALS
jgi:tetratricopeptide (TPR) repeat protein